MRLAKRLVRPSQSGPELCGSTININNRFCNGVASSIFTLLEPHALSGYKLAPIPSNLSPKMALRGSTWVNFGCIPQKTKIEVQPITPNIVETGIWSKSAPHNLKSINQSLWISQHSALFHWRRRGPHSSLQTTHHARMNSSK